jgi:hypothetical protein
MNKGRLEGGQSLVLIAVAFVGIIAFVGFAIDTGIIYLNRIWLGQAVDAASLAAGFDLPNIKGACARAVEYLEANDYIAGSDFEYDIIFPNVPDAPGGDPGTFVINSLSDGITIPEDCDKPGILIPPEHQAVHYQVKVVGRQKIPVIFMSILGFGEIESGVDGLSERTRRFDISLVLDNSGSMVYDTCGYHRDNDDLDGDLLPDPDKEGYTGYAANNLYPVCTDIVGAKDDFSSYDSNKMLEEVWVTGGDTDLLTSEGHTGHFVEMRAGSSNQAFLLKRNTAFDVRNWILPGTKNDIALFFWVKNISMGSNEYLERHWREWNGAEPLPDEDDWIPLSRIEGSNLDSSWEEMGIVMPNAAANKEYLQIRFGTQDAALTHGVGIDDVMFKSCPPVRVPLHPLREYKLDNPSGTGCRTGGKAGPMNAHILAPHTMIPMEPGVDDEPITIFLEQPMYDVLRSTETFIDLIDARRFDTNPPRAREDQFSLVTFSNRGELLYDLTDNYEDIKLKLFTGIEGENWTNLGDGMRMGLNTLVVGGRSNTLHYMVLLTDGRPNRYGPAGEGHSVNQPDPDQATLDYIQVQIDFAIEQNVVIYVIGLGEAMLDNFSVGGSDMNGMDILIHIASETGGQAYHAPTTAELEQIFEWIAESIFVRLTQ